MISTADPAVILDAVRSGSGEERRRALRVGAETLDDALLVSWLREEADDVLRNAGFEMLKLRGRRALPVVMPLLEDADEDVVLQAVLVLDHAGDPSVWPSVRPLLQHANINIVQAAIAAAGRLGTSSTARDLLPFLESDFWLQLAAIDALGQLRAQAAVPALARLLFDPDLGDAVADALTRIGGLRATRAVARFWVACRQQLAPERWLPLLLSAITSSGRPLDEPGLREALSPYLDHADERVSCAAAAAMLAIGPGDEDGRALDQVASAATQYEVPAYLARRNDLAAVLLAFEPPPREWGWALAPRDLDVTQAFVETPPADDAVLVRIAESLPDIDAVVQCFLRGDAQRREVLAPVLARRKRELRRVLLVEDRQSCLSKETVEDRQSCLSKETPGDRQDCLSSTTADRALLMELAGAAPREVAATLAALDPAERANAVAQIRTRGVMARLPWQTWLDEDEATYAPLLGETAARLVAREFAALVRRQLKRHVHVPLVACCAALGDRASVPLLARALDRCDPAARVAIFRALGTIGGNVAREILENAVRGDDLDARLAARAIAENAAIADPALVRELAVHRDWAVRLAAAEVLEKSPDDLSRHTLAALAADPVTAVAQRARAALDRIS